MPTVRTPGASPATRDGAAWDSAFPFERHGRLLRSRSISGLFSRSLYFGLQPPCLRFAMTVAGHHARLTVAAIQAAVINALSRRSAHRSERDTLASSGSAQASPGMCSRAKNQPPAGRGTVVRLQHEKYLSAFRRRSSWHPDQVDETGCARPQSKNLAGS